MATAAASPAGCLALGAFDRLPAGVLVCDLAGTVLGVNARGASILARCAGEVVGQPIARVLAPLPDLLALADDPDPDRRREALCPHPDGARPLGYSAARGDAAAPVVVIFRDLTAERSLREERDRLLRMAMVGDVLPSVLHELRNPLAAVTSAMENLVEESLEDAGLEPHQLALHAVLTELRRMSLVFQGIGSVGRSLAGPRPAAVDLAIEEASRIMEAKAERSGVALACHVDPMPLLPFDLSVVRAVTFNLVNNAVQACRSGDAVRVSAGLQGDRLRLTVRDTGRGMTAEVLAQCLRPFFTTRPNGSGLGLVICREAVEEAGGTLTLDSAPGLGTAVTVLVPVPPARRATGPLPPLYGD